MTLPVGVVSAAQGEGPVVSARAVAFAGETPKSCVVHFDGAAMRRGQILPTTMLVVGRELSSREFS